MIVQQRIVFQGKVQGIGFRYRFKQKAEALGVKGQVQNMGSDKVQAIVCGEDGLVQELVEYAQRMPAASVDRVRITAEPVGSWDGFRMA